MTHQPTLFPPSGSSESPQQRRSCGASGGGSPAARRTDPISSHVAADKMQPHLQRHQQQALVMVRHWPGRTARELAHEWARAWELSELEEERTYRRIGRRLKELTEAKLVRRHELPGGCRWWPEEEE